LIAFVHVDSVEIPGESEEREKEDGGGEKEAAKNTKKEVTAPRSIVGLVKGETSPEISNLRKFVAATKQQLQDSGAGCVILDEKDVPIAGTRGYQLLYTANAPPNQRMKCLQRLAILGEFNYVILFQTLEPFFDEELALANSLLDSFQTFA